MMRAGFSCQVLGLLLMAMGSLPLRAELQGAGLEGGSSLKPSGNQGLGGARLEGTGLQGGRLNTAPLQGAGLQPAKPQQGAKLLSAASLKRKASELAEAGLGVDEIQGAASTIPRSQVGALLYDVAGVLLAREEDMTAVAVGYYMAVLADPQGERHDDALARLREIFLDRELLHEDAVRIYDGGLETMKSLVDINIGLTADGYQAGLRTLQEVKAAYHKKRQGETAGQERVDEKEKADANVKPSADRAVTGNQIDGLLKKPPISTWQREDVGKQEPAR